jgi:transposase
MAIINDQQACELAELIDQLQQAERTFWTTKAFHSYIGEPIRSNVLIIDNASWHKRKATNWHSWQPKYLPPYSPDLNPIEQIRLTMKARWFNNYVCKNEEELLDRLDQAIFDFIDNPNKTQKTTAIGTLF